MNHWDRLAAEPDAAWALFREWRDHSLPRPSAPAWCREHGRPNSHWPREFSWDSRALAWDQYVDERRQNATVTEVEEMARRHITVAHRMLSLVEKSVGLLEEQLERRVAFRPNELTRMVDVATKLERISRGQATERVEGTSYEHLSDEDLATLEEIANRATTTH